MATRGRIRNVHRGLLLGGLLTLAGCENFAPPHQAWALARVEGRVVDERTGAPLAAANVWRVRGPEVGDAYSSDKGAKQLQNRPTVATSDADGRFMLVGERTASLFLQTFPDFAVTLRFQRDGYETVERRFTNVITSKETPAPVIQTGDVSLTPR